MKRLLYWLLGAVSLALGVVIAVTPFEQVKKAFCCPLVLGAILIAVLALGGLSYLISERLEMPQLEMPP